MLDRRGIISQNIPEAQETRVAVGRSFGGWTLGFSPRSPKDLTPVTDYVVGNFVPISRLTHEWEFHSAIPLSPAEERTVVREPVQAIPAAIAQRLGKLRVLAVAYIACLETGDVVTWQKPKGEAHTAAWVETPERINLLLACRELDAHDTGFELLGSVAELLRSRLSPSEVESYNQILEEEVRHGVRGEIDEDALNAKQVYPWTLARRADSRRP
jgi:hypothetical protein